jgi:hypothetical protein
VTSLGVDIAVGNGDGTTTSDGGVAGCPAGGGAGPCGQAQDGRSEGVFARSGCGGHAGRDTSSGRRRCHDLVRTHAAEVHVRPAQGQRVLITPARRQRLPRTLVHHLGWVHGAAPASRGWESTHKSGGTALPGKCICSVAPFIFFPLSLVSQPSLLHLLCVGSGCVVTLGTKSPLWPTCTPN